MVRVIPCHLNNNVRLKNSQNFIKPLICSGVDPAICGRSGLWEKTALLQRASDLLTKVGVVAPSLVCDGEVARQGTLCAVVS
jgi:hypothetical protein